MPEEKVGKRVHPDSCLRYPPAGDAGPRQPHAIVIHKIPHCVCGHAHDVGNICSRCACRVAKLCNCAQAATPVPQEAAPHSKKCAEQLYSSMDAKCICGSDTVQATAPDSAMRVAERLGTCRTPHFLGEPTPDRKALTQIPHQELPQGLCRDWQAIDRVAATEEPQSKGQDGSTVFMQTNTAPVYMCPAGCGCLWRDNQDGTMSLYGPNSKSCEKCEYMPLKELTPLIREAGSERERELREIVEELQLLRKKFRGQHTLNEAEAARCDVLIDLLASRLLGGE